MSLTLPILVGAAALAWAKLRRPSSPTSAETVTLAPLDMDPRFNGADFVLTPQGLQIIRAESVPKLMAQLAQRGIKGGEKGQIRSYFLIQKKSGSEPANVWLQKAALAGRSVLINLNDKPVHLVTVPANETATYAQPGRAILMWGA